MCLIWSCIIFNANIHARYVLSIPPLAAHTGFPAPGNLPSGMPPAPSVQLKPHILALLPLWSLESITAVVCRFAILLSCLPPPSGLPRRQLGLVLRGMDYMIYLNLRQSFCCRTVSAANVFLKCFITDIYSTALHPPRFMLLPLSGLVYGWHETCSVAVNPEPLFSSPWFVKLPLAFLALRDFT